MGKNKLFSKKTKPSKQTKEKKEKQKVYVLPTEQKKKFMARSFWTVIVLVFALMIFFILRSFGYSTIQARQQAQLAEIEKTLKSMKEENKVTDNLDVFCRQFVSVYYATNKENQDTYQKGVKPYFSAGIELPKISTNKIEKKLTSLEVWGKEALENQRFSISYLVHYSYEYEKKSYTGKEIIHFSVEQKNNKYAVITYPYFEAMPTLINQDIKKQSMRQEGLDMLAESEAKPYQDWLTKTFFPKYYADTPLEEMKYMMAKPSVLGNVRKFDGLNTCEVFVEGKKVSAYVVVKTIDPVTQAKQEQEMTIVISQKNNTYQIEKLAYFE